MSSSVLFSPVQVGDYNLKARMVYAPLTRNRAIDNIPREPMQKYYAQRAHDGYLVLSEATAVCPEGIGYPHVPGLYNEQQIEGWKPIVKAVKDKGATIFAQLWHGGRASSPEYQPEGKDAVGPSAIAIGEGESNKIFNPKTYQMEPHPVPRALETDEISGVAQQFAVAAQNAITAGFDGVEIHGANGYLLSQFLNASSNKRTDKYGGSIENRCRFVLEVVKAVANAIGSKKVGIRLSPYNWDFLDSKEPDVESSIKLNTYLVEQLDKINLAYLHLVSARVAGSGDNSDKDAYKTQSLEPYRKAFSGPVIAAGGYIKTTAEEELTDGVADLVAFGRHWIANPDLPERFKKDAPLNKYDRNLFYSQEPVKGYTDYPFLNEVPEDTPTFQHYSGVTMFEPSQKAVQCLYEAFAD